MEILNFGQLSLAAEKDKLTLCYVVMYKNKIKRVGNIPPCDYKIERCGSYGYINLPPEYELGRSVSWITYSSVMESSLGLDILYLGISREKTLNKVKEELERIDEEITEELNDLKKSHREISTSLRTLKTEMEYVGK